MKTVFKNNNGLLIMENMESYLRQKMPDCCLYSDDGYKFMIHKVNISDLHHTKGVLKYYFSKEVGGWGQKMAIYADVGGWA